MTNIITELTQAIQSIYPHLDNLRLSNITTPSSPNTFYPALHDVVVSKLNSPYFVIKKQPKLMMITRKIYIKVTESYLIRICLAFLSFPHHKHNR